MLTGKVEPSHLRASLDALAPWEVPTIGPQLKHGSSEWGGVPAPTPLGRAISNSLSSGDLAKLGRVGGVGRLREWGEVVAVSGGATR